MTRVLRLMRITRFLLFLVGFLIPFAALAAGRPAQVGPACDANIWDVLSVRGQMEAQREVEIAQTLIKKPDSVLEYACFSSRLSQLAASAVFQANLQGALDQVVNPSLEAYLGTNFGRAPAGGGTCGTMAMAATLAQCTNAQDDLFRPFIDFTQGKPEALMQACGNAAEHNEAWQIMLAASNPAPGGQGGVEAMARLPDLSSCANVRPILTGLSVTYQGESTPEGFCPAAGCVYQPGNPPSCAPAR